LRPCGETDSGKELPETEWFRCLFPAVLKLMTVVRRCDTINTLYIRIRKVRKRRKWILLIKAGDDNSGRTYSTI